MIGSISSIPVVWDATPGTRTTPVRQATPHACQAGEKVSISAQAQVMDSIAQGLAFIRSAVQKDPAFAAEMARNMAYGQDMVAAVGPDGQMLDIHHLQEANIRNPQRLNAQMESVRRQRIALYEQELAKGTPPAQIYDKLAAFIRGLPESYKSATGLTHW